MRIECWIPKVTNTHTQTHTQQYVILIALTRQQWLHERASMLRYTNIACLLSYYISKIHIRTGYCLKTVVGFESFEIRHFYFCRWTPSLNVIHWFLNIIPSIVQYYYINKRIKGTTTTYETAKLLLAFRGPSGMLLPNPRIPRKPL